RIYAGSLRLQLSADHSSWSSASPRCLTGRHRLQACKAYRGWVGLPPTTCGSITGGLLRTPSALADMPPSWCLLRSSTGRDATRPAAFRPWSAKAQIGEGCYLRQSVELCSGLPCVCIIRSRAQSRLREVLCCSKMENLLHLLQPESFGHSHEIR